MVRTAKIDKKEVRKRLLAGESQTQIANDLGCKRQYISLIKLDKGIKTSPTGVINRKPRGNGYPEFEELEDILHDKRDAIDKMIEVIALAKQADLNKEEAEMYKRKYHNLMGEIEAEKKTEKKKTDQKLAYQLAVQHGELPKLI